MTEVTATSRSDTISTPCVPDVEAPVYLADRNL